MQSGLGKTNKWILEFETKEQAVEYAKKNNINFEIQKPKKRKMIIKSYADNFLNK